MLGDLVEADETSVLGCQALADRGLALGGIGEHASSAGEGREGQG